MDLYSRRIVGWAMADHLPLAALKMAISAQRPAPALINDFDRGFQYASAEYRKAMQSGGFKASMSRKCDCYEIIDPYPPPAFDELPANASYAIRI